MPYQGVISRKFAETVQNSLKNAPVTAILGPRQCGKTTLVNMLSLGNEKFFMLDLERPSDRDVLLRDAESFFDLHSDFVRTFLERDIAQLGFRVSANQMRRIWTMFAHNNACVLNRSKLGESLGVSHHTVSNYIGILTDTFMLRTLPPFEANLKKRLVKSPKIIFRDSGILHYLLNIKNFEELFAHPDYGASFESFAIEQILSGIGSYRRVDAYFYRSHQGEEIDLVLDDQKELTAIEIKSSSSPNIPKGFRTALDDLKISRAFVVAPVNRPYSADERIYVCGIAECVGRLLETLK